MSLTRKPCTYSLKASGFCRRNADSMYTGFNGLLTFPAYNEHKLCFGNELWMAAFAACRQMTTTPTTHSGLSGQPYHCF